MKNYEVTYYVKKGHVQGGEHRETRTVEANNAKEACQIVVKLCREKLGYNAFRPTAKRATEV